MAAMMLPEVAPSALRVAAADRAGVGVVRHVGSYLAVWAAIGVVVITLYRPHSTTGWSQRRRPGRPQLVAPS
jgi:predicted metal-binding membrane protein